MEKKYELTTETIVIKNKTLYRIRALRDFSDVSKGDLGGYIEKEYNLSHYHNCWVYDEAAVYDDAEVSDNAVIKDQARVYDRANVREDAEVGDYAQIYGGAEVYGDAEVYGESRITGVCFIFGNAYIGGKFEVDGPVNISQGYNAEEITIYSTGQWYELRAAISKLGESFKEFQQRNPTSL